MVHRFFLRLLVGFACAMPALLFAAGVYTGSAPVPTQSDQDRATALRAAMSQALVQAAKGDAGVLKRPEVARALSRAERYARGYSYQPNPAPSTDPRQASVKLLLIAQFDAGQIDALVRSQTATATADAGIGQPVPAGAPAAASAPAASAAAVPAPVAPLATDSVPAASADSASAPAAATYHVWFSGLRSAEDYARLVAALNTNAEVRGVRIEQAHGNVLQTRIDARGSLPNLIAALDAAHIAHTGDATAPLPGVDAVLDLQP